MNGFQYLEQRDSTGTVSHSGVVSKDSPFVNEDNSGIYDVIAEDLRVLKDLVDDKNRDITKADLDLIKSTSDQITQSLLKISEISSSVSSDAAKAQTSANSAADSDKKIQTIVDNASTMISIVEKKSLELQSLISTVQKLSESIQNASSSTDDSILPGKVSNTITFYPTEDHKTPMTTIRCDEKGELYVSGAIHGNIDGNVGFAKSSDEATRLKKPIKINGVEFDGSTDITVDAGLMDKKVLTVTLFANTWSADKTYVVKNNLIKSGTSIILMPTIGTSDTVFQKVADGRIVCDKQEDGAITLKCLGDVIDQDINVSLLLL